MFKKNLLAAVAIAVALPTLAAAGDKPLTKSATVEVKATVVAVDLKTRDVTLKGPEGKTFVVQAGDQVKNLDQVKPGDVVAAAYTEALAFQVVPKGEKSQGVAEVAERVPGGGVVGRQVTTYFKIDAYNVDTHLLWGTTADGNTQSITVKDPAAQAKLAKLPSGTVVEVTYTQSLAIKLEKTAK